MLHYTVTECQAEIFDYVCVHCGEQKQEGLSHFGHNYGSWVTTIEPTEETVGLKVYTCTVCNGNKTEILEKLPHTHKHGAWTYVDETTKLAIKKAFYLMLCLNLLMKLMLS